MYALFRRINCFSGNSPTASFCYTVISEFIATADFRLSFFHSHPIANNRGSDPEPGPDPYDFQNLTLASLSRDISLINFFYEDPVSFSRDIYRIVGR